jgi:hypothetical protein
VDFAPLYYILNVRRVMICGVRWYQCDRTDTDEMDMTFSTYEDLRNTLRILVR